LLARLPFSNGTDQLLEFQPAFGVHAGGFAVES
jgi:hypothetical protein